MQKIRIIWSRCSSGTGSKRSIEGAEVGVLKVWSFESFPMETKRRFPNVWHLLARWMHDVHSSTICFILTTQHGFNILFAWCLWRCIIYYYTMNISEFTWIQFGHMSPHCNILRTAPSTWPRFHWEIVSLLKRCYNMRSLAVLAASCWPFFRFFIDIPTVTLLRKDPTHQSLGINILIWSWGLGEQCRSIAESKRSWCCFGDVIVKSPDWRKDVNKGCISTMSFVWICLKFWQNLRHLCTITSLGSIFDRSLPQGPIDEQTIRNTITEVVF